MRPSLVSTIFNFQHQSLTTAMGLWFSESRYCPDYFTLSYPHHYERVFGTKGHTNQRSRSSRAVVDASCMTHVGKIVMSERRSAFFCSRCHSLHCADGISEPARSAAAGLQGDRPRCGFSCIKICSHSTGHVTS